VEEEGEEGEGEEEEGRMRRRGRGEEEEEEEGISRELWWQCFYIHMYDPKGKAVLYPYPGGTEYRNFAEYRDSRNFGFLNVSGINSI